MKEILKYILINNQKQSKMKTLSKEQAFEQLNEILVEKGFSKEEKGFEESIGAINEHVGYIINEKGESIEDLLNSLNWSKTETKQLISSKSKNISGTFISWTSIEGFSILYRSQAEIANNKWNWNL